MTSYAKMENILIDIEKHYLSLDDEKTKYNTNKLINFLDTLTTNMKAEDELFDKLYNNERLYVGSFFDNLKIGAPDEYDVDLLMVFPKCENCLTDCTCVQLMESDTPGWLWLKISKNYNKSLNKKNRIEDDYLQTDKILDWFKGVVDKALNKIEQKDYDVQRITQSGPAVTLRLNVNFDYFDIDLVPSFKFEDKWWPRSFTSNNNGQYFYVVPKSPKNSLNSSRYWRASFPHQERARIKSELRGGKERLVSALKLLKKMRNNLNHKSISSYALKTIVLWDVGTDYYNVHETLSGTFIKLMKKYRDSLQDKRIPYFWQEEHNLLNDVGENALKNHCDEISKKISKIDTCYETDPYIIAEAILKVGTEDYDDFCTRHGLPLASKNIADPGFNRNFAPEIEIVPANCGSIQGTTNSSSIAGWVIGGAIVAGVLTATYEYLRHSRR